jgi:predicted RNase H-like nuclease
MFAGVDACKGGWVVAKCETWPCKKVPVLAICPNFTSVVALTMDCKKVAVDIPIGLARGKRIRKCDLEAKKMLSGHNTSALFYAPPRETLSAETPQDFQRLHRIARGVGAGLPVWGFLAKVRETNLAMTAELQERIVEFHPELTWFRLAGENLETKHNQEGIAERKKVLRKFVPELERILRWKDFLGRAAAIDDLLDALAGIAVAKDSLRGTVCKLPDKVEEIDSTGLRMEIWY